MSVGGCFTDFHLDFGGTSVWYHLLSGEKWFLLVPPTADNYSLFVSWQLSGRQDCVFFADLVERAQLVRLEAGHTMLMPAGLLVGRGGGGGDMQVVQHCSQHSTSFCPL